MAEQQMQAPRTRERTGGDAGPFNDDPFAVQMATVQHLTNVSRVPVVGMTVGAVRHRLRDRLEIPQDSTAVLDGRPVGDEAVIGANQTLVFTGRVGVRGACP